MLQVLRLAPTRWWSPKAWWRWRSYLRWRLETYGAYYPQSKLNPKALRPMLKQLPSYRRWLAEFSRLRRQPFHAK